MLPTKQKSWMAATVASAFFLAGCATVGPADLQGELGQSFQAEVSASSAAAFRQLVTRMRACYLENAFRTDADFFPDLQRGKVSLAAARADVTLVSVDIEPVNGNTSKLTVSYYNPARRAGAAAEWRNSVVPWARGEDGYCVLDQFRRRPD